MSLTNGRHDELWRLLEAVCEDDLTMPQAARLEEILKSDADARRYYLEYLDLHGALYWDTAVGGDSEAPAGLSAAGDVIATRPVVPAGARNTAGAGVAPELASSRRRFARLVPAVVLALLVAVVAVVFGLRRGDGGRPLVRDDGPQAAPQNQAERSGADGIRPGDTPIERDNRHRRPFEFPGRDGSRDGNTPSVAQGSNTPVPAPRPPAAIPRSRVIDGSVEAVVAAIDRRLREGWQAVGLEPSPVADDAEWMRRAYLDLVGHIPPAQDVARFLDDRRPAGVKRSELIDRLLEEPAYVRHWTTVMTNLLIGRSLERDVNRPALEKFFRESFAANRPWDEIVTELVAAEGFESENGAATFLLAHLNNEAVPATAITARLFLGVQVGCVQCHDHPFNSDWHQEQFWELNSFFQQTQVVHHVDVDPATGRRAERTELASRPAEELTFFETPRGVVRAVKPGYFGEPVDPAPDVNRRRELARLMFEDQDRQAARAMVNRMWAHFFGYGFTRPVDDMGPHNPPTHPELLDELTERFVDSGYDLQSLMRWITNSEAYQLTSRAHGGNASDDPDAGEPPAFSRMYVKPMTAEQLYDSVLVATRADLAAGSDWDSVARQRQAWLQQFVHAFDTEENDEATNFEGTIPQALTMMNGELVATALGANRGTFFASVAADRTSDAEKIRTLCLAALSRYPTEQELNAIRNLVRTAAAQSIRTGHDRQSAAIDCLRDVFWAYLNSSEFRLVH